MGGFITDLSTSMEKETAEDENFDKSSINAVKLSLMGPFAGIGDSIFQGSLRIISLGICVALAAQGSILGVILHLLLYNVLANLLPLLLTFVCYKLLKKNVKPIWIMLGMMVVGIIGKIIGIF